MQKFNFSVLALILSLPFLQGSFFGEIASADADRYPYQGKMMTQVVPVATPLGIILPQNVTRHLNGTFSNLDVVDDSGKNVEFGLYRDEFARIRGIDYLDGTEIIAGNGSGLVDDNHRMGAVYPKDKTRVKMSFDLGKPVEIAKLRIDQNTNGAVTYIQISGAQRSGARMETFLKKKKYNYDMNISSPLVQFVEVELWGSDISIQEMSFYQAPSVVLTWDGQPGKRYELLYGGKDTRKKYERIREESEVFVSDRIFLQLREEVKNENYDYDDGDSVDFWEDNCGFDKNPSQQDNDNDKIGDACDNAPGAKNRLQQDTDYDGVGDLIDNCRYVKNEDQKDKDGDSVGNACDTLPGVKNNVEEDSEPMNPLFWMAIVAVLITAGVFGADYYINGRDAEETKKEATEKK